MHTNRRSVLTGTATALAGGAALNVAAIVAAKAAPSGQIDQRTDPIFDLIERHKRMREEIAATDHDGPDGDDRLTAAVVKLDEVEDAILAAPF